MEKKIVGGWIERHVCDERCGHSSCKRSGWLSKEFVLMRFRTRAGIVWKGKIFPVRKKVAQQKKTIRNLAVLLRKEYHHRQNWRFLAKYGNRGEYYSWGT